MKEAEKKAIEMYNSIPDFLKGDIVEAGVWARAYMERLEGVGHEFFVTANVDGTVSCSFAKPEWKADHTGRGMEHGAEAIVMAVCEYVNGM